MTAVDERRTAAGGSARGRIGDGEEPRIVCHLDRLLETRGMTLVELSEQVGVTAVNLSVLKNGRAKAIRFSTLVAVCGALGCGVGDLLEIASGAAD